MLSVGNGIYDPCFTVPRNHERMVCGADPALKTAGFVLKLTKPLPETPPVTLQVVEPWIIKLADGSICEAMTGTLPAVNGQSARWSCAIHIRDQVRPAGVVTTLTPGKIWMADRYPESAIAIPGQAAGKAEAEKSSGEGDLGVKATCAFGATVDASASSAIRRRHARSGRADRSRYIPPF